jgi:hypothetical protein
VVSFGFAAFSSSYYPSAYLMIRANEGTVFAPDLVRVGLGHKPTTTALEETAGAISLECRWILPMKIASGPSTSFLDLISTGAEAKSG